LEAVSMLGKNCVITGATSGIGKATALELGKMGARVTLVGRNTERGKKVTDRINTDKNGGHAEFIKCDLSSQADVRGLARTIAKRVPSLDVLVNNAGAKFDAFSKSKDGIEMTFATNHLNYFLLTALLMHLLMKSPAARIVNVAGENHWSAHSNFQQCFHAENYDRRLAAWQAKLANLMFTYELAERLQGLPVTVNAVHPGAVATRINRNNGIVSWMRHIVAHLLHRNLISPRKGADSVVWLATSDEVQGVSGKYFYQRKEIDSSPESKNKKASLQLWDMSLRMTELKEEEAPSFFHSPE
jgi:NAD(P)-dependent dehydrogenase (short-subunit alcohol dehydrogenase family)